MEHKISKNWSFDLLIYNMETKIQKIKENLNTLDDKIKQPRLTMQENIQKWKKICILKLLIFVRKL